MNSLVTKRLKPQKIALMDFDGVVMRNVHVHNAVRNRVDHYVGRVLKTECGEVQRKVNTYLYNTYGHSLLGLEKVVGRERAGTLRDFNTFVYEEINLDRDVIFEVKKEIHEWNQFIAKMKVNGIPVYMFSNAPRDWCLNFIDKNSVTGFIGESMPLDSEYLKPEVRVFEVLNSWFPNDTIYFVDDKIHNMKWSIKNENWVNIVFDESQPRDCFKLQDRLFVSKTLDACGDVIC